MFVDASLIECVCDFQIVYDMK